jgi:hypothetical protein
VQPKVLRVRKKRQKESARGALRFSIRAQRAKIKEQIRKLITSGAILIANDRELQFGRG